MSAIYAFLKNNGDLVRFGPHESDQAAMEAFQFRYGYWPTEVVSVTPYTRDTSPVRGTEEPT